MRSWPLGQLAPTLCSWAGHASKAGARSCLCRENVENPRAVDVQAPPSQRTGLTVRRAVPLCPVLLPPCLRTEGTCEKYIPAPDCPNNTGIIVVELGRELWPEQGGETPLGAALMGQSPLAPQARRVLG